MRNPLLGSPVFLLKDYINIQPSVEIHMLSISRYHFSKQTFDIY